MSSSSFTLRLCPVTFCYCRFCISWDTFSRHLFGGRLVSNGIFVLDHFANHSGLMQFT